MSVYKYVLLIVIDKYQDEHSNLLSCPDAQQSESTSPSGAQVFLSEG